MGEVGMAVALAGGSADGDEDDIGLGNRTGQVGGEAQPAGRRIPGDDLVEAGLVDRHLAAVEILDLLLDLVDAGDRVAELGKTCPGDEADISGSDNCYAHDCL